MLVSIISNFLDIEFNIVNIISLSIKSFEINYSLWCDYCHFAKIKDSIFVIKFCFEYPLNIILYIVLSDKKYVKLDIWPNTLN